MQAVMDWIAFMTDAASDAEAAVASRADRAMERYASGDDAVSQTSTMSWRRACTASPCAGPAAGPASFTAVGSPDRRRLARPATSRARNRLRDVLRLEARAKPEPTP
jgi:hypothetical protein